MSIQVRRAAGRAVGPACLIVLLLGSAPGARAAPPPLPADVAEVADHAGRCVVAVFAQRTEIRREFSGKVGTKMQINMTDQYAKFVPTTFKMEDIHKVK